MTPKFVTIAAAILSLYACGDDSKSTAETTPTDATGTETSGETASTLDMTEPDTTETCPVRSETSATTGADGAVLQLCGATLTVPADAAPSGTSVTLKVVAPPGPAPFEQAFVSPAFEVGIAADFNSFSTVFGGSRRAA